jgi:uncharacterized membrane-anchored protein
MCRTTQLVRDKRLSQHQQTIAGRALTKVPEITVFFWITKILTTAMGEATSDFMNAALGPAIAVPLMLIGLVVALKRQFKATGYHAWNYWLVVVMVAVFGTSCADALHVGFGIPYTVSSAFYLIVLAVVFTVWYRSENTLSIHSIYTRRREQFYWATVLATFALGTAAGDMTATNWHLGYLSSGLLFVSLFALPAVAYRWFGLNSIFAFWFAYIMTRPLGASFADWLDATTRKGGLALGTGPVAVGLAVVMVGFIAYLAVTRIDVKGDQQVAPGETPHVQPVLDLD